MEDELDDNIDDFDDIDDVDGLDDGGDDDQVSDSGSSSGTYTREQVMDMLEMARKGQQPAASVQPQQLTTEQIEEVKRQLRYPQVNKELVTEILGELGDEDAYKRASAGLTKFVEALSQHARAQTDAIVAYRLQQMQQQVQPLVDQTQQQKQSNFIENVAKRFPALGGKKKAIAQAVQQMRMSGYINDDITAAMRDTARTAASIIRVGDPTFRLKQTSNGSGGMQSLGRPGAGTKGGASSSKKGQTAPAWKDIWS